MALCLTRELDLTHALHYLTYSELHLYCNGKYVLSSCLSNLVRKSMHEAERREFEIRVCGKSYAERPHSRFPVATVFYPEEIEK